MNYKAIDCSMKEIYFDVKPINQEEENNTTKDFWYGMDIIALQNMTFLRMQTL